MIILCLVIVYGLTSSFEKIPDTQILECGNFFRDLELFGFYLRKFSGGSPILQIIHFSYVGIIRIHSLNEK